jgi:hypothetical protein
LEHKEGNGKVIMQHAFEESEMLTGIPAGKPAEKI